MNVTIQWIWGFSFGIEFTSGIINEAPIGYCLIDLGITRLQFAWFID
jgi:hypothetical protein